jgi:hypothetical protein
MGFFWGPIHTILPFLLLGVGVDNSFVIMQVKFNSVLSFLSGLFIVFICVLNCFKIPSVVNPGLEVRSCRSAVLLNPSNNYGAKVT